MTSYKSKILMTMAFAMVIFAISVTMSLAAVSVGQKAPEFNLHSVTGSSDIKLANYFDKPTLLVFYVSWCPHCKGEIPTIQRLHNELGSKGLNVVGVDLDSTMADAKSFAKSHNISFPNAHASPDSAGSMLSAYGISGVPMVLVLDKGGVIKALYKGEVSEATVRSELAKLGIK